MQGRSSRGARLIGSTLIAAALFLFTSFSAWSAETPPIGVETVDRIGGSDNESVIGLDRDAAGNFYVGGHTFIGGWTEEGFPQKGGLGLPSSPDREMAENVGYYAGFVAKYSPAGELVYSTLLPEDFSLHAMTVGLDGAVYLAGSGQSKSHPGSPDAAVLKLAASGRSIEYQTLIGSSRGDRAEAIAVDATGSAYVGGWTEGADFSTTGGVHRSRPYRTAESRYESDGFLSKLTPSGGLASSTFLEAEPRDLDIAPDGSLVAVGDSFGNSFVAEPSLPTVGRHDGFVARLSGDLANLAFVSYVGGKGSDFVSAVDVDVDGVIHLTGETRSGKLEGEKNPLPKARGSSVNVLYGALARNGKRFVQLSSIGGDGVDGGRDIEAKDGEVLIAGSAGSPDFPAHGAMSAGRPNNGFVVRIAERKMTHSTLYGSNEQTEVDGLAIGAGGRVHVGGFTRDRQLPGESVPTDSGGLDGFAATLRLRPFIDSPTVRSVRRQPRRTRRIGVTLKLGAAEDVTARIDAKLAGRHRGRRFKIPLSGAKVGIPAYERRRVVLRTRRRSQGRRVHRALRKRKSVSAIARVRFSDGSRASTVKRRTIRLRTHR